MTNGINPRYEAFCKTFGEDNKNWVYVDFINKMKVLYVGCIYAPIFNHDEFTKFIQENANLYENKKEMLN